MMIEEFDENHPEEKRFDSAVEFLLSHSRFHSDNRLKRLLFEVFEWSRNNRRMSKLLDICNLVNCGPDGIEHSDFNTTNDHKKIIRGKIHSLGIRLHEEDMNEVMNFLVALNRYLQESTNAE